MKETIADSQHSNPEPDEKELVSLMFPGTILSG
jgi:hypothetical protein